MNWHTKAATEVISELKTSEAGLSTEEAGRRLEEHGPNALKEEVRKGPLGMFLDQFRDFMILVLVAAAVVSGFIGEVSDTVAIVVIVLLNAVIGFIQEYRAEQAMAALKKLAAPAAVVIRDNTAATIPAVELVPGDIVVLEAGQVVPADMRLMEAAQFRIEEAALTGESIPSEKDRQVIENADIPLGDRRNMAYKGTIVSYGRGSGIVVATGMSTELGRIAALLQKEEEVKTPLQKRLARLGRRLAFAVIAICAIVFGVGVLRGEQPILMLLTAISLAVAAIPEALPAVVTISLAIGARKMVRQHALIRKLPAVETLGSVTYICSDKTGTLTQNRMTVEEIFTDQRLIQRSALDVRNKTADENETLRILFIALGLSNDAREDVSGNGIGDPTEIALYSMAKAQGFRKADLEQEFPRVAELPFDSERKCMTTFHRMPGSEGGKDGGLVSFTKGAFDVLVEKADSMLTEKGVVPLDRREIEEVNERMAADGLRVLCIARRLWDGLPEEMLPEGVESRLTILGLAGMMDPPRQEAADAVAQCRSAGIRPVMITGDHPLTAKTIARRIGVIEDDGSVMITGAELDRLSLEEFEERVEHIRVYARVAPEQKLKIVKALQDRGQFVAMTGDGVNDAPALKRADIGVAMGITGTDVAKEAAHMILLDDNFATIVRAVKEGRKIYDNIRKFIRYLLTTNSGEIWTLFLAPLAGLPVPLLPIHILWINLVTDGLPALALSAEPPEGDIMSRPPRRPGESVFAHGLGLHAIWVGLLMAGIVLAVQAWSITTGNAHWQTMVFTVLCLTQLGHVLAIRSEKESLFRQGLFSNPYLLAAVVCTFLLQMATIYVPFLNPVFKTVPLTAGELLLTLVLSSVVFWAVEVEKLWRRRRGTSGPAGNNQEVL